jgi:hypothetical protein
MLKTILLYGALRFAMGLNFKEPTASDSSKMMHGQIQAYREVYLVVNCKGDGDQVCAQTFSAIDGAL